MIAVDTLEKTISQTRVVLFSSNNVIDFISAQPPSPATAFGISIDCATTLF